MNWIIPSNVQYQTCNLPHLLILTGTWLRHGRVKSWHQSSGTSPFTVSGWFTHFWQVEPRPRGRPPVHKTLGVPEDRLVEEIQNVLFLNGLSAEKRRRSDKLEYFGTPAHVLRDHLYVAFPEILHHYPNGISLDTVRRWLCPPHIGTVASRSYHSLVQARPSALQNTAKGESAVVSAQKQLCSSFSLT